MKYEITITQKDIAVAWSVDIDGVKSIADIRDSATQLFKLSKKHSVVGKTGEQILWAAYPNAVVTADNRFDS